MLGFSADAGGLIRSILPTTGAEPGLGIMGLGCRLAGRRSRCQCRKFSATADADIFLSRINSGASTTPGRARIFFLPVVYGDDAPDASDDQKNG